MTGSDTFLETGRSLGAAQNSSHLRALLKSSETGTSQSTDCFATPVAAGGVCTLACLDHVSLKLITRFRLLP